MEEIKRAVRAATKELFNVDIKPELSRPDEQFGDYATNVALQLTKRAGKNPRDIAEQIAKKLQFDSKNIAKTEVAGPGFINITLTDEALIATLHKKPSQVYDGKTIVIEHTDPNPFKEFHIGHAYSNTIGESIGRLYKAAGAKVHQVSYHGDVGLHIAKAVFGLKHMQLARDTAIENIPSKERPEALMGVAYAFGAQKYEEDDVSKQEINSINKKIYERNDSEIKRLYNLGRQWSFDYFDSIYKRLNVSFEKQYFESETGPDGIKIVEQHIEDGIFEKSDGAIVFKGEKFDLHTRVFITSQGLPTYEAKELGLAFAKQRDYHFDEAVVVTANEIDQYFQVLLAALGSIDQALAAKIRHVSHGVVKLPSGKMSSRTGQVITAVEVLDMLERAVRKVAGEDAQAIEENILGALKYAFLKHRIGGDIVFDVKESVSLEGNSGPYLQYAHARARSILAKSQISNAKSQKNFKSQTTNPKLEPDERSLLRKITEYPEAVEKAVNELMPHHVCTYLFELAQVFNRFYEKNRVIDDPREAVRLQLAQVYADTLKNGLTLLNIPAPDKM